LKDLNGYFPFTPPKTLEVWKTRREEVRRRILVSQGLWPMPEKGPLNAVIHGRIDRGDHTVEKVYFESSPGFFVTGNLYRPKEVKGKVPGIMFAHGHWKDARLSENPPEKVRQEIAIGAERFEQGGRSIFQSMCVQLARMGCVVWQWDMLSDSDSNQFTPEIIHRFAKQRPEMNTPENWGLYSPRAESHLQSVMGLQTWNAVRGLDFLLTLPEVDPERTAITGASGGGTQTMLLAAIDDRVKLSFPVVMVSTAMQGGCTCENSSLLRVGTGNIEFAALFAPRPQGMNTANDWTKELATKGFPDLKELYGMYGKKDDVFLLRGEHFQHNYNAVTRSAFYTFINKHFRLGQLAPVIERDFEPLSKEQLTVWDGSHPEPKEKGPEFERRLLRWFSDDSAKQLERAVLKAEGRRDVMLPALKTVVGRDYEGAGEVRWDLKTKQDRGGHFEMDGLLVNGTHGEEIAVRWLYPKNWNGRAVVWLEGNGLNGMAGANGAVSEPVGNLLREGTLVVGADLFRQGRGDGGTNRVVANPREFAGYTYGYNHPVFAQRVHDVLSVVRFLREGKVGGHVSPKRVDLVGWGVAGPVALAARALAGSVVERCAVETGGFRFGAVADYRDEGFLPGGAKYLDVPGLMALNVPGALWVAGEREEGIAGKVYGPSGGFSLFRGDASAARLSAVTWLQR
jgi:dienelactone hydrolase